MWILIALAAVLIVFRAATQSITVDEATTYGFFVGRAFELLWTPAANNHLLNSLLMKASVVMFGVSPFTVRIPALIGAAFYLSAAARLSGLIGGGRRWLAALVFAGLVFNPFILDYLVAARGYSLALGFLLSAVAVAMSSTRRIYVRAAVCSALLGLCFVANFAFAIAAFTTLVACFVIADRGGGSAARLALAWIAPGLAIAGSLSARTLARWQPGQFTYGARTLAASARSLIEGSFYQPDPRVFGKTPYFGLWMVSLVALAAAFWLVGRWIARSPATPTLRVAGVLAGSLAVCVLLHWIAFQVFGVLLPKDRTAAFVVPIVTVILGILAAETSIPAANAALRGALVVVVIGFALSLRVHYFKEWFWNADTGPAYAVVAQYQRTHCITEVGTTWMYAAPLEFYRLAAGNTSLNEVSGPIQPPEGKGIYVLHPVFDYEFIGKNRLRTIYASPGELTVAVAEQQLSRCDPRRP